jgi:C1A family cysteine protease
VSLKVSLLFFTAFLFSVLLQAQMVPGPVPAMAPQNLCTPSVASSCQKEVTIMLFTRSYHHGGTDEGQRCFGLLEKQMQDCHIPEQVIRDYANSLQQGPFHNSFLPVPKTLHDLKIYRAPSSADVLRFWKGDELRKRIVNKVGKKDTDLDADLSEYKKLNLPGGDQDLQVWGKKIQDFKREEKASCTPVDLRKELGPVRDQQSAGLCYAFATSDLIAFKTHQSVSYFDLALQTTQTWTNQINRVEDLDGGYPNILLQAAKLYGTCSTKKFSDDENSYEDLKNEMSALINPDTPEKCSKRSTLIVTENMKDLFLAAAQTRQTSLKQIIDKACEPREKTLASMTIQSYGEVTAMDGIIKGLSNGEPSVVSVAGTPFGAHAMLMAGRKWNEKAHQCQYILKNSWGDCSTYGHRMMQNLDKSNIQCAGGYLFINRETLSKIIKGAAYLHGP